MPFITNGMTVNGISELPTNATFTDVTATDEMTANRFRSTDAPGPGNISYWDANEYLAENDIFKYRSSSR